MLRIMTASAFVLAGLTSLASAQEMGSPVPPAPPQAPPMGQWYLGQLYVRGDLGGAFSSDMNFRSEDPGSPGAFLTPGEHFHGNTGNSMAFDIGVGSRLSPYLRWDATLSYLPSLKFSGSDDFGAGSVETADGNSLVGMVNGYIDLAGLLPYNFGPFQPYVDAGVGAASNTIGPFYSSLGGAAFSGGTQTSFAWGLGAGVGYPIAPNVTLDVSYKYLDLGEMNTGTTETVAGAQAAATPLKGDLRENTVMVGLRYGFP